ncbi:polysaccharide deacetylase family protein [Streptomyces sp. NPDC002790]|uniref:polysaccharide deacetylase family protein n=1 Tax=Streptomyces sp. NPDC002790 TaxID=3154431 RepID=UPI003321F865
MTPRGPWARLLGCALAAALLTGCARGAIPAERTASGSRAGPQRTVPPIVSRVPTADRVVFLAYEGGAGQGAEGIGPFRDRHVPVSLFLAGAAGGGGDGGPSLGAQVQNRTLTHVLLPGLGYVEQHAEICGQRDRIEARFGTAPRLLHPPSGAYDGSTLLAAGACAVDAIVLWREPRGTPRPGDILPVHGMRQEAAARLLDRVRQAGLTVGRLEDYL